MRPPAAPAAPPPLALADAPPLATLPELARAAFVASAVEVELEPGAVLLSSDDAPPALYVVLDGVLLVEERLTDGDPDRIRALRAGELVDQLQVLAGRSGAVIVSAEGAVRVARIPDGVRDALALEHRAVTAMLERLHRDQLYCRLHTLFGAMDRPLLDELEATAEWVHLRRGDLLIEREDVPDALYLVISGRLRTVRVRRDGTMRVLSEAGRGETVGEMSFFGCDPRGERVEAVRDSVLVGFTDDEFERLVAHRPRTLRRVTRMVVDRATRPDGDTAAGRVTNVAVLAASPGAPLERFCERLRAALEPHGSVFHLTAARVDGAMAEAGISGAWGTSPRRARLLAWLEARELDHRFVVYEADAGTSPWTRRCLRQADRVLLVASADDPAEQGAVERALDVLEDRATDAQEVLVLVHRDGSCLPSGTARWREERTVADHLHLRWDGEADFHRLARILAGRSVGVVLGGGGARGFAHIGVLRALEEAGVAVDAIGGTSMGAAVAAQYAVGMSPAEMLAVNRRIYLEWRPQKQITLPMVALVDNRLAQLCGTRVYGEAEIEDLWLPYFCVTSNLSSAEMVVHTRGLLRRYVLASASIPVFAPPVLDGNQLLVDGALLNNLPTDVMRALGHGVVIASEVSLEEDLRFTAEHVPTAWEVVRGRLRLRPRPAFPGIMEMAMRASLLHSTSRERSSLEVADLCFNPPVEAFALMDFERIDEIVEAGYAHASRLLAEHAARVPQGAAGSAVGSAVPSGLRPL